MATHRLAPSDPDPTPTGVAPIDFMDVMQRTRIAMADAGGFSSDTQLCQMFRLTPARLAELRLEPLYQAACTEHLNRLQSSIAARRFEMEMLGDLAIANARHYLENRAMVKENLDMTKTILTKLIPNPEQAVRVTTNSAPHFSIEATLVLNERLPGYARSLEGAPTINIADDPNLSRSPST